MPTEKRSFNPGQDIEEENIIENALHQAGLSGMAQAPRPGTDAYRRLMAAAVSYMVEVRKVELPSTPYVIASAFDADDSYFKPDQKRKFDSSSSDSRRIHHETMAKMLLNKSRKGLPKREADQLSNFAAYVTGDKQYINKW